MCTPQQNYLHPYASSQRVHHTGQKESPPSRMQTKQPLPGSRLPDFTTNAPWAPSRSVPQIPCLSVNRKRLIKTELNWQSACTDLLCGAAPKSQQLLWGVDMTHTHVDMRHPGAGESGSSLRGTSISSPAPYRYTDTPILTVGPRLQPLNSGEKGTKAVLNKPHRKRTGFHSAHREQASGTWLLHGW